MYKAQCTEGLSNDTVRIIQDSIGEDEIAMLMDDEDDENQQSEWIDEDTLLDKMGDAFTPVVWVSLYFFASRANSIFHSTGHYARRLRTWAERRDALEDNWDSVLLEMSEAYLRWKYGSPALPEDMTTDTGTRDSKYDFTIRVLDIFTLNRTALIKPSSRVRSGAAALVEYGFIGVTPLNPSRAIGIKTLELFRRIRLRKPSFSVEAFTKLLCDYYSVSSRGPFRDIAKFSCVTSGRIAVIIETR